MWQYFDRNEQLRTVDFYIDGKKNGLSIYYYPNGETYESYEFKNDLKHGDWIRYDRDKNKTINAHYKNGKLDGCFTTYFKNGITKVDGMYQKNKRHGKWIFYTSKGQIDKTINYTNGLADNQDELDEKQRKELDALEANKNKDTDPEDYIENPTEYLMKQKRK